MTVASCETFGLWHRWRTVEVVADRRRARDHHAVRVTRCERCGTLAYRWAPLPDASDPSRRALDPAAEPLEHDPRVPTGR